MNMDGDSTLKSLMVGRLGSAITGIVALLAVFGTVVSPADVQTATGNLTDILNNGYGLIAAISMAVSTGQALYSKYKKR